MDKGAPIPHTVNCMLCGNMKAAASLLDLNKHPDAPLSLNMPLNPVTLLSIVYDELLKKHSSGQPAHVMF